MLARTLIFAIGYAAGAAIGSLASMVLGCNTHTAAMFLGPLTGVLATTLAERRGHIPTQDQLLEQARQRAMRPLGL